MSDNVSKVALLFSGGIAGSVAKTVVAPLERLRIMAQTGHGKKSMFGTGRAIIESEGVFGLWRGNFVNCIRVFPSRSILFSCNDMYKGLLMNLFVLEQELVGKEDVSMLNKAELPPWVSFFSGSLAGMTACTATYPLDVARTRMTGRLIHSGAEGRMMHVLSSMAREEGLLSWYRGIGPTLFGAIPYEGIKFAVFDISSAYLSSHFDESNNVLIKLTSGALGGAMAGLCMFPNDTVRRLMQMQGRGGVPNKYRNSIVCAIDLYKTEGITRFYRGMIPYLVRMIPNSAIQFTVYELLKSYIKL